MPHWRCTAGGNLPTDLAQLVQLASRQATSACQTGGVLVFVLTWWYGVLAAPCPAIIIIIIIIIIIAFKGAIRDVLQFPHSAVNCLQHVRSSGPGATVCKSRATHPALITCKCHVTCHLVRRDSSAIKFDRVEIAFIWALFYCLNHETDEGWSTPAPSLRYTRMLLWR